MTLTTVALITGAGRGIGRAIALRLAKDGYNIALNDVRQNEGLDQVRIKAMVDTTAKNLGGLDVMVANAGVCITKSFLESTLEDWDKLFDVNGKGLFLCYKYAAQQMIQQGRGGRIVGACSQTGKQGMDQWAVYSATKFTVRSLTQSAATALKTHGITVNAYAPGAIDTQLLATAIKELAPHGGLPPDAAGDVGTPEQVAALVSYLVSKDAQYVTGQSINIDGGRNFD